MRQQRRRRKWRPCQRGNNPRGGGLHGGGDLLPGDPLRRPAESKTSMKIVLDELQLVTTAPVQIIDITDRVIDRLTLSGVRAGLLTLMSRHTTAFVNLNEREPNLQKDMVDFLARIAPAKVGYRHDAHPVDDRANAHAHLAGLFMTASQSIPVVEGKLLLGDWQSILFIELDGPRPARSLRIQVMGTG